MKKISILLSLGLLLTIFSCENSTKQDNVLSPALPSLTKEVNKETKLIEIVTPYGETIKMPVPADIDENKIEFEHVSSEAAIPRNTGCCITTDGTPCTSVLTFYAIPRNAGASNFEKLNINVGPAAPTYPHCGDGLPTGSNRCKTYSFGMNKYVSTGSQDLESGDLVELEGLALNTTCVDFLLIMGQWNCSGGKILFYDVCESGQSYVFINQVGIGKVTTCYQKCGLNPIPWTPTCSSCS